MLALEETALLKSACPTIRPCRHIEDHGVGVELRRGVSIDRTSRGVLELRGDKLAGGIGGVIATDPRLGVSLKLIQSGSDGCTVGIAYPVIAPLQAR